MDIDALIGELIGKILKYETGDMVLIAEIIAALKRLGETPTLGKTERDVVASLAALAELEMNGKGPEDFTGALSQGLDVFQDFLECRDEKRRKRATEKAEEFMRSLSPSAEDRPKKGPAPETHIEGDLLAVFLSECDERMSRAEQIVLELENDLENMELINELFRIFHTIKGECGFLKIDKLGELSHNIENILDLLRTGKVKAAPRTIDGLLEGVDVSRQILKALGNHDIDMPSQLALDEYIARIGKFESRQQPALGEILLQTGKVNQEDLDMLLSEQRYSVYGKKLGQLAVEAKIITPGELKEGLNAQRKIQASNARQEKAEQIVKVKASKVNYLVDMIGELLIAMGQIQDKGAAFAQVRKISKSLQRAGMDLRTESVRVLFGNAKRVVRDLTMKLGKEVGLETFGEELEIDRNLIEKLDEPMMHIVRNSLDHGIESEEERARKGKPATGKLTIGAERRGNNIVISVADDGKGLDRDKILAKAVERGIVSEKDAPSMSDGAVFNLIFIQGFSTKESVDYVSGRGVGMDIVKTAVTAAKGRIEIRTEKDAFTRILLIFPLSTAIIEGMLVRVGKNTFIAPIASIIESVSVKPEAVNEVAPGVEVIRVREEVIPLIRLASAIGLDCPDSTGAAAVIVENADKKKFALSVDEILAKREVVIKSLGTMLKDLKGISSGTVLAEGKIGLVLDVDQVISLSESDAARRGPGPDATKGKEA